MTPLLKSFLGSTTLRVATFAIGYLAAQTQDDELPYFLAILLALLLVSWVAEHYSLEAWHRYKTEKERADG